MSVAKEPKTVLPSQAWAELQHLINRFEDAWQRGEPPTIDDYLPSGENRQPYLVELVHAELEYRLQRGQRARVEEYFERFPELAQDSQALIGLIVAEYQVRRAREPGLPLAEYQRRFPLQAAELQRRFERGTAPASDRLAKESLIPGDLPKSGADFATKPRPDADRCRPAEGVRNLLFVVLALQRKCMRRDGLKRAMLGWVLNKAKPLGQIAVEQGSLTAEARDKFEAIVELHLEVHGGDSHQSLAELLRDRRDFSEACELLDESLSHLEAVARERRLWSHQAGWNRFRSPER